MIKTRSLRKIYANGFKALDGVDIHIAKEDFVYLVGPSGAGKSTLLKMLYRAEAPTSGEVYIDHVALSKIPKEKIPYLRRNVGVIFQDYKLLPKRTVYENVAFALQVVHADRSIIRRKVAQAIELVGLQKKINNMPSELSGGEQQRICIARAIVNNPPILVADEPTGSLDPETSWEIMHLLNKINTRKTTVIVATHDQKLVDHFRKRVIRIENGKVISDRQLGQYHGQ